MGSSLCLVYSACLHLNSPPFYISWRCCGYISVILRPCVYSLCFGFGFLFCFCLFVCLLFWLHCSMQDLPQPEIEAAPAAVGAWSFNHWTTREVRPCVFLNFYESKTPSSARP